MLLNLGANWFCLTFFRQYCDHFRHVIYVDLLKFPIQINFYEKIQPPQTFSNLGVKVILHGVVVPELMTSSPVRDFGRYRCPLVSEFLVQFKKKTLFFWSPAFFIFLMLWRLLFPLLDYESYISNRCSWISELPLFICSAKSLPSHERVHGDKLEGDLLIDCKVGIASSFYRHYRLMLIDLIFINIISVLSTLFLSISKALPTSATRFWIVVLLIENKLLVFLYSSEHMWKEMKFPQQKSAEKLKSIHIDVQNHSMKKFWFCKLIF